MPVITRIRTVLAFAGLLAFGAYCATVSSDFAIYYRAAGEALQGGANLYPAASDGPPPVTYFRAAPIAAWLFVPLAWLPFKVAALLFFALKIGGLVAVVFIASGTTGVPPTLRGRLVLGALAASGAYMVEELRYGNAHLLVLPALVVALQLAHAGRVWAPAFLFAAAIALKLSPVLVVVYLALIGRIRVAAAAAAATLVLLIAPALWHGVDQTVTHLEAFTSSAARIAEQPRNHSLRGVIFRYLTTETRDGRSYPRVNVMQLSRPTATALWMAALVLLGAVLVPTIRRRTDPVPGRSLKDSLVFVAMLLMSTHTQRIHYSALFYPACVLMGIVLTSGRDPQRRVAGWALGLAALVGTILPLALPGRRLAVAYEMASPYCVAALMMFAALVWLVWRQPALQERTDTGHDYLYKTDLM